MGRSRTSALATATGTVICPPPRPPLPPPPFCLESALVWPQPLRTNATHAHIRALTASLWRKGFDICPLRAGSWKSEILTDFYFSAIAGCRRGPVPLGMCRSGLSLHQLFYLTLNQRVTTLDFVNNCK